MEMELNILMMLKTAIAAGVVLCIGSYGLYVWLKHTGQLKSKDHHKDMHPN